MDAAVGGLVVIPGSKQTPSDPVGGDASDDPSDHLKGTQGQGPLPKDNASVAAVSAGNASQVHAATQAAGQQSPTHDDGNSDKAVQGTRGQDVEIDSQASGSQCADGSHPETSGAAPPAGGEPLADSSPSARSLLQGNTNTNTNTNTDATHPSQSDSQQPSSSQEFPYDSIVQHPLMPVSSPSPPPLPYNTEMASEHGIEPPAAPHSDPLDAHRHWLSLFLFLVTLVAPIAGWFTWQQTRQQRKGRPERRNSRPKAIRTETLVPVPASGERSQSITPVTPVTPATSPSESPGGELAKRVMEGTTSSESVVGEQQEKANGGVGKGAKTNRERVVGGGGSVSQARMPSHASESSSECVVCHDAEKEAAFFPCGHRCVCLKCADMLHRRKIGCPICRTRISQYARIYDT